MNDKVVSSEQFCFFTQPRLVFGSFEKVLLKDIILCFLYCTSDNLCLVLNSFL